MTLILDGKAARVAISARLKESIAKLPKRPTLAIIQVGDKEESSAYIKQKIKFGEEIGAGVLHIKFSDTAGEKEIIGKIGELNADETIDAVIVQLPLPESLFSAKENILNSIIAEKDADGLSSESKKIRKTGQGILPATARGVMELLEFYKISLNGKKVAVLGRSILAGAPIAEVVIKNGGLVKVCHSKTPREEEIKTTKESDIIIAAIGKPKFLTAEFFTAGAGQAVVDVGINKIVQSGIIKFKEEISDDYTPEAKRSPPKFVGDVDFEGVLRIVGAISPVPGGVGQMTVLALFENLYDCCTKKMRKI